MLKWQKGSPISREAFYFTAENKPGSVFKRFRLNFYHLSWPHITAKLQQPTRQLVSEPLIDLFGFTNSGVLLDTIVANYIRELLPHVFTIAIAKLIAIRLLFSVALSVDSLYVNPLPVRKRSALFCPDFPPFNKLKSDRIFCNAKIVKNGYRLFVVCC